ncbi:MAG: SpoIIE family protein phosphatase [Polyangiaceae bacterium]|nr:SpoIIE family protein phosphatase [Polyangiaceae bacterium]
MSLVDWVPEAMVGRLRTVGFKLGLLAGIPVLGALLLGLAIMTHAIRQAQSAESLGSVESVAELSVALSRVAGALQAERAGRAMLLGATRRELDLGGGAPEPAGGARAALTVSIRAQLAARDRETDLALEELDGFLADRDLSRMPTRLRDPLRSARAQLQELGQIRDVPRSESELRVLGDFYGAAIQQLIGATAALTELSDDGDLLRLFTALVSAQDLKERASREHALLAYVFARGSFPPGAYRSLVTVVTEQDAYEGVFRTNASRDQTELFESRLTPAVLVPPRALRQQALDATDEAVAGDPALWFERQQRKISGLGAVVEELNARVQAVAAAKRRETVRVVAASSSLAVGVLLLSVLLALVIGRGISRSVSDLRNATQRVGEGDLAVRVTVTQRDEIGQLGTAFNAMIEEIADARSAQIEQARLSREVEIAASIQGALLPAAPEHEEFEFAGRMVPADEVGGDFYDVLAADENLWLAIGDVSSHGLSAGLVMLMAQATFASFFSSDPTAEPDRVIRGVNRVLHTNIADRMHQDKYLTAQLFAYRGRGRFACAGAHEWPIVFRKQTLRCEILPARGPWLGILPDLAEVPVSELTLEPGDVLCLYSDGLTEARDAAGEQFDLSRLTSCLEALLGEGAALERVLDGVYAEVRAHVAYQDDDWSMLLVRRRG